MRLVTWNCHGKFYEKFEKILTLDADIYIISESVDPEASKFSNYLQFQNFSEKYLWNESSKNDGISVGIFVKKQHILKVNDNGYDDSNFISSNFHSAQYSFNIIGMWPRWPEKPEDECCAQEVCNYLKKHTEINLNYIIAGDMNIDAKYPRQSKACKDKTKQIIKYLNEDKKLFSAYHEYSGEEHEKETMKTYYFGGKYYDHEKGDGTSHLDYVFLNKEKFEIVKVYLGEKKDWLELSDHIPLIIDFKEKGLK